jgi:hypothetical protein
MHAGWLVIRSVPFFPSLFPVLPFFPSGGGEEPSGGSSRDRPRDDGLLDRDGPARPGRLAPTGGRVAGTVVLKAVGRGTGPGGPGPTGLRPSGRWDATAAGPARLLRPAPAGPRSPGRHNTVMAPD